MKEGKTDCVRKPEISILIPTLNEAGNIDPIITRILSTIEKDGLDAEVMIVDGGPRTVHARERPNGPSAVWSG